MQNFYVSLCLATFYQFPNNQLDQKCDMHVLIRFKAVSAMPEYTTHVYILLFAYLILFALLIWFSSCYYFWPILLNFVVYITFTTKNTNTQFPSDYSGIVGRSVDCLLSWIVAVIDWRCFINETDILL